MEEEEYEDILEDIKEECNKYGVVRSVEIPRPIEGVDVPGCGKVSVESIQVFCYKRIQYYRIYRLLNMCKKKKFSSRCLSSLTA